MAWHAVEEISEALDDVRELLLPFDRSVWIRLAIIVFFVGGGSSGYFPSDAGSGMSEDIGSEEFGDLNQDFEPSSLAMNPLVIGLVAGILAVVIVFSYLSAVFEFIFYRSLDDMNPVIRENFSRYRMQGFKLLVFRFLFLTSALLSVGLLVGSFMLNVFAGLIVFLLLVPFWIGLWILSFLVKNFAVPEMVLNETGFMDSIRKSYRIGRENIRQTGMFLLIKIVLGMVLSLVTGLGLVIVALIIAVPVVLIGGLLYLLGSKLALLALVPGVLAFTVLMFGVLIPVRSFLYRWVFRTYSSIQS